MTDDATANDAAAGALALQLMIDFLSHQQAVGAIAYGEAAQLVRRAGERLGADRPGLDVAADSLVRAALTRFDREEAARFE